MKITSRSTQFDSLYRGYVKDNEDPKKLGRCRVHIPDIYGAFDFEKNLLPWARPITTGSVKIPEVDDVVWILFEGGLRSAPIYMTGVITTKNPVSSTQLDVIYEKGECRISYDRESKTLLIEVGDSKIELLPKVIKLTSDQLILNGESGGGGSGIWYYDVIEVV